MLAHSPQNFKAKLQEKIREVRERFEFPIFVEFISKWMCPSNCVTSLATSATSFLRYSSFFFPSLKSKEKGWIYLWIKLIPELQWSDFIWWYYNICSRRFLVCLWRWSSSSVHFNNSLFPFTAKKVIFHYTVKIKPFFIKGTKLDHLFWKSGEF